LTEKPADEPGPEASTIITGKGKAFCSNGIEEKDKMKKHSGERVLSAPGTREKWERAPTRKGKKQLGKKRKSYRRTNFFLRGR